MTCRGREYGGGAWETYIINYLFFMSKYTYHLLLLCIMLTGCTLNHQDGNISPTDQLNQQQENNTKESITLENQTEEGSRVFQKTDEGYISFKTFNPEEWSYVGEKGSIHLILWTDGKYREKTLGYILYNPESCIYEWVKWIYDWIDYSSWYETITEVWCFRDELRTKGTFGSIEDENGSYYQDKDWGWYNLRRISTKTWAIYLDSLVTTDSSGWIEDRIYLTYFQDETFMGDDQVFMNGKILSGVTNPRSLKIMSLDWAYGPIISITDGKMVWYYKTIFEWADPNSLKYFTWWIYIDNKSCYIAVPIGEIQKLDLCNPKKIKKITNDPWNWMDTKMYSDGMNIYNENGDIIKN